MFLDKKTLLNIWLNLGLNVTIFLGTGPRPLIQVRLNFFIPQFKYMKFIYSYLEKGCRKKCTRQSRKVLLVVLSSPLTFQRNLKEWQERPWTVCLRVLKKSDKSRFDSYSVRKSVMITSHISLRDCRVHIFSDDFSWNLKQLYSSFIFPGLITNQLNDQLSVDLLAQLVGALHHDRKGQGSPEFRQAWIFSGFLFVTTWVAYLTVMIFSVSMS